MWSCVVPNKVSLVRRLAVGRRSDGEGRTEQPQRGPCLSPLRGGGIDAQRVQLAAGDRQAEQRHRPGQRGHHQRATARQREVILVEERLALPPQRRLATVGARVWTRVGARVRG